MNRRICVGPSAVRPWLRDVVRDAGALVVDDVADAEALVWTGHADEGGLRDALARNPRLQWVQLPWAGIEPYVHLLDDARVWTAGQGIYAVDVAEHVLALTLAGLRDFKLRARATSWQPPSGISLHRARVTVIGGGAIARELQKLLAPFHVELTIVRRRDEPFAGASRVLLLPRLHEALIDADVVVVACALTPQTEGCLGARELQAMKRGALLVNVGRGRHVDTDALVQALREGPLRGACLDVTEPEPLPQGHALWDLPNCLITPHCANTPEMAVPVLSERVRENVRRFLAGEPLVGVVDVDAGY